MCEISEKLSLGKALAATKALMREQTIGGEGDALILGCDDGNIYAIHQGRPGAAFRQGCCFQ